MGRGGDAPRRGTGDAASDPVNGHPAGDLALSLLFAQFRLLLLVLPLFLCVALVLGLLLHVPTQRLLLPCQRLPPSSAGTTQTPVVGSCATK